MMNRIDGGVSASEVAHIRQCIGVILGTRRGSRVMRRDFGSDLSTLVDTPANPVGLLRLVAAAIDAVERWEPRVVVDRGAVVPSMDGSATVALTCRVRSSGASVVVDTRLGAVG